MLILFLDQWRDVKGLFMRKTKTVRHRNVVRMLFVV